MVTKTLDKQDRDDVVFEGKTVGQLMVEGLTGLANDLKSGVDITKKYTCRNVSLEFKEVTFSPQRIIKAREVLGASQTLFADFLGFSANSIRSWEQGVSTPKQAARNLFEFILEDPAYWQKKFQVRIVMRQKISKGSVSEKTKRIVARGKSKNTRQPTAN